MGKTLSETSIGILHILLLEPRKTKSATIDNFPKEVMQLIEIEPCRDNEEKEWVTLTKEGAYIALTTLISPMSN